MPHHRKTMTRKTRTPRRLPMAVPFDPYATLRPRHTLRYDPHIPRLWIRQMEAYADELGLPEETMEALGRNDTLLEAFLEAQHGPFDDLARAIAASARGAWTLASH